MELILISDSKLKIMLSSDDMEQYAIDCDTLDYDNTETRRAFWNILDEAKHQTGFDAASDKVFIQVYPSKNGGCEMYVTKLNVSNVSKEEIVENTQEPVCKINRKSLVPTPHYQVYSFDCMEHLLAVCNQLARMNCKESSRAYVEEERPQYYLVLCDTNALSNLTSAHFTKKGFAAYPFMTEYGKNQTNSAIYPYIQEHCRCICEKDAVQILADMV